MKNTDTAMNTAAQALGRPRTHLERDLYPGKILGVIRRGAEARGAILSVVCRVDGGMGGRMAVMYGPEGDVCERHGIASARGRQMVANCTHDQ